MKLFPTPPHSVGELKKLLRLQRKTFWIGIGLLHCGRINCQKRIECPNMKAFQTLKYNCNYTL